MYSYELHNSLVNFQMVSAHHVLKELHYAFGNDVLIGTLNSLQERDKHVAADRRETFNHVLLQGQESKLVGG